MGQEQDQAAEPLPFVLRADNELIHNRLGGIPKIAVLRLPYNQGVGIIQAVAIFETENAGFRERTIENLDRGLVRGQVLKGRVSVAILKIMQHRVPLAESPALGVLSRHAHAKSFAGQTRERQ